MGNTTIRKFDIFLEKIDMKKNSILEIFFVSFLLFASCTSESYEDYVKRNLCDDNYKTKVNILETISIYEHLKDINEVIEADVYYKGFGSSKYEFNERKDSLLVEAYARYCLGYCSPIIDAIGIWDFNSVCKIDTLVVYSSKYEYGKRDTIKQDAANWLNQLTGVVDEETLNWVFKIEKRLERTQTVTADTSKTLGFIQQKGFIRTDFMIDGDSVYLYKESPYIKYKVTYREIK